MQIICILDIRRNKRGGRRRILKGTIPMELDLNFLQYGQRFFYSSAEYSKRNKRCHREPSVGQDKTKKKSSFSHISEDLKLLFLCVVKYLKTKCRCFRIFTEFDFFPLFIEYISRVYTLLRMTQNKINITLISAVFPTIFYP